MSSNVEETAESISEPWQLVVAAGRGHRPFADEPAVAILFEPSATKQYGDQPGR